MAWRTSILTREILPFALSFAALIGGVRGVDLLLHLAGLECLRR